MLKIKTSPRDYRKNFSKAYEFLYQDESLCYLTEILDSAQEGIPYLLVNGEKFTFSNDILDHGNELYVSFCSLVKLFRECFMKLRDESFYGNIKQVKSELKKGLCEFDQQWVTYEEAYINELIYNEKEARQMFHLRCRDDERSR